MVLAIAEEYLSIYDSCISFSSFFFFLKQRINLLKLTETPGGQHLGLRPYIQELSPGSPVGWL